MIWHIGIIPRIRYTFLLFIGIILVINGISQYVIGGSGNLFILLGILLIVAQVILDILFIKLKRKAENKTFSTKVVKTKRKNKYLDLNPDCPMCKNARSLGFEICPDCNKDFRKK